MKLKDELHAGDTRLTGHCSGLMHFRSAQISNSRRCQDLRNRCHRSTTRIFSGKFWCNHLASWIEITVVEFFMPKSRNPMKIDFIASRSSCKRRRRNLNTTAPMTESSEREGVNRNTKPLPLSILWDSKNSRLSAERTYELMRMSYVRITVKVEYRPVISNRRGECDFVTWFPRFLLTNTKSSSFHKFQFYRLKDKKK